MKFPALAAGRTVQRPAAASEHYSISIPSLRKGSIVKRVVRLPLVAGGLVMAAVLASLAPTTSSQASAQVPVYVNQPGGYYNPYGQGPYGGYGLGYVVVPRASGYMFPNYGGIFRSRAYGYPAYGYVPSGYGNRFEYGIGPQVQVYGGTSYYQPSYGPVYGPFGYRSY